MKRIIAILLTLATLLSCMAFVSCSKDEEETKKPNSYSGNKGPVQEGDIFAERAAVPDDLPANDFGGRKFRIITHRKDEFFVDEDMRNQGDLIADAKYMRNKAAEDRFNFEVEVTYFGEYSDVNSWASKAVLSGADEFDLFCSHSGSAGGLVTKNLFLNWYDIPNVDFSKPWWSSCCANELTYDGKCILAVSDFNYTAYSGAYCMLFNKDLANAYDLGNLYEVVLDGKWTFDYFANLVRDIYTDADGDGNKSEGDFYGFVQAHQYRCPISSWLFAFDNPPTGKDADGVPVITIKTEKINNIVSSLYDLLFNAKGVWYQPNNDPPLALDDFFLNDGTIFTIATINTPTLESLRNFNSDYGLLPLPKWDENQQDYHTWTAGEHTVLAVPKTCRDTEFVGTAIEALSAESYKQVVPTLYEIALKTRYLRDNESKEVLDIVISGVTYDFGGIFCGLNNNFAYTLGEMFEGRKSNFESYYSANLNPSRNIIKRVIKSFDKLG